MCELSDFTFVAHFNFYYIDSSYSLGHWVELIYWLGKILVVGESSLPDGKKRVN